MNGKKTKKLLKDRFGNDGYSLFYQTLEILGKSERHFFDFSDELDWLFYVSEMGVSEEKTVEILDYCVRLRAFDKELYEKKVLWSDNFVENLKAVYDKRTINLPEKPFSESETPITEPEIPEKDVSDTGSTQSIVEESKEEKSLSACLTQEEISEGSDILIDKALKDICEHLYKEYGFKKVHAFRNKALKEKKNKRAILHALTRCKIKMDIEGLKEPWGFCNKIIQVENGNFNESDHIKDQE